jgi:hypothetical protein
MSLRNSAGPPAMSGLVNVSIVPRSKKEEKRLTPIDPGPVLTPSRRGLKKIGLTREQDFGYFTTHNLPMAGILIGL